MNDYEKIKTALKIARDAHRNQKDKSGEDYIYHPVTVALLCQNVDEKTVALLHDTIEDCSDVVSYESLEKAGFEKEIIDAVKLVTHIADKSVDKHEDYRNYIKLLKASGNQLAINVKIADLTHNSDTSRMGGKKSSKYEDYIWALEYLKA